MNEKLLEFIWINKLLPSNLATTQGEKTEVLNYGTINHNSGPDIYAAKIRIGNITWVGNVEFHVKSSHWHLHGHNSDLNYKNIILHIVFVDDQPLKDQFGNIIPTIIISESHPTVKMYKTFSQTVATKKHCPAKISLMSQINRTMLRERLAVERLQQKTNDIKHILKSTNNDWNNMFFRLLARAFGFGKNAIQMETLAASLNLQIIEKNRDSLYSAIAIMLGQACLIPLDSKMQSEYNFYKQKYNLQPLENIKWEKKLRPQNQPSIRIKQLTALICKKQSIFSHILDISTPEEMVNYFIINKKDENIPPLSKQSALLLTINAAIPAIFVYGKLRNLPHYQEKAIEFLQKLPSEENSAITKHQQSGLNIKNAWDSQAALQLENNYCKPLKCIECQIFRQEIINANKV